MLTIGVNEEYDEWGDEEEAILIVQLVILCLCNVLHNNYRLVIQNDIFPKEFKQLGKPQYLLSNYLRRLMKNVNDLD